MSQGCPISTTRLAGPAVPSRSRSSQKSRKCPRPQKSPRPHKDHKSLGPHYCPEPLLATFPRAPASHYGTPPHTVREGPVATCQCVTAALDGAALKQSWPHRELHPKLQWRRSHASRLPITAHPTRGSWLHRGPHQKPHKRRSHESAPPITAPPSYDSWPHRSSTYLRPQWRRPHAPPPPMTAPPIKRFLAQQGTPRKAPMATFLCVPATNHGAPLERFVPP